MMAGEMIEGGPTERVMKAGGEDAYREIAAALAGRNLDVCVYALTRAMTSIGLNLGTHEAGVTLVREMADDAINELELNREDRAKLLAEARAVYHSKGGRA